MPDILSKIKRPQLPDLSRLFSFFRQKAGSLRKSLDVGKGIFLIVTLAVLVFVYKLAQDTLTVLLNFGGSKLVVSLIGFILFVTVVLVFFPGIIKKLFDLIKNKFPRFHNRSGNQFAKAKEHVSGLSDRFRQAPVKKRRLMLAVPLLLLMLIYAVLRYWQTVAPPQIAVSYPGDTSADNPLDTTVEVIFDKEMNRLSVEKSFSITPQVDGSMSWEGTQKLIFTPKKNLDRGASYAVKFNGFVFSKFFVPVLGKKSISFETIGNPGVVLSSPRDEAPEDLTAITVVFDRPMIPLTTATNSGVKKPAFNIIPDVKGEGRWLGTTAYQFRPTQAFKKATTYKVTVPAGITSQDGGVIDKEFSWEFYSPRPRVEDISPKMDYEYASPTASVSAKFSQDLDRESLTDKFKVYDKNNHPVTGRIVVSGREAGFYPSPPLNREEKYRVVLEKGILGEGPNGMEDDYQWSFTTAAKPQIISATPADGSKDVKEMHHLEVAFKTPMDEDSFKGSVTIIPEPETDPYIYFSSYNSKNILSVNTYLARSADYKITIGLGATDQYGVPLDKSYTFSFKTAAYNPSISIEPSGTYFGSFNQEVVPRIVAQATNVNKVDYSLYRLKREDLLDLYRRRYTDKCGQDNLCRNWQNYNPSGLEKVRSWSESFETEFNTPVNVITKVTDKDGKRISSGFYFLDVKIPTGTHDNMVMIVTKSALTVKKSENQIFTWTVRQATGDVVPDMNMELTDVNGGVLASGKSNADGVFIKEVDLFRKENLFVFGSKGDDLVVAASAWDDGISRYDFGLPYYYNWNESKDYRVKEDYKMYIFPDRPIYRPGQKVYFKGLVKKDSDGAFENVKSGDQAEVEITDSQNKSLYKENMNLSSYGSFWGDFELSEKAGLGQYQLKVSYGGSSYYQPFQVEEYKKQDLAVTVNPSKKAYVQGEAAEVLVNASYYFGAPVTGAPVSWTLQTQDYAFRWDKDWRFEFGDPDSYWSRPWWNYSDKYYFYGEKVTEGKSVTDSKGDLNLNLPLNISKFDTSQIMTVEAVVNDINNQSVAGSSMFTVHKAGVYAGLRPDSYSNRSGREVKVEVVSVDTGGKEMSGINVEAGFYKRTWETVREKDPDSGQFYYTSKASDALVATDQVTTDDLGRGFVSFTPEEGGTYKVVSKVTDSGGNTNTSGTFLWVSGYGFVAERANNDRIILVTDKRDYLVGDDMSVFVASPYASDSAKTLVTAERGSVINYKIVDTSDTSNNFIMNVAPKYSPNVFIGAVLVRGGSEVKKPAEFKMGYTEVKVTDKKNQVNVKIATDKKRYKPQETMKVSIQTNDLLGHPVQSELAVGLVDKAVWDLSDIEIPDIYKFFYQPKSLGVDTSQLLSISIDRINANTNLGSKGGSGGGCFTGDTPVLMKGEMFKNIQDVQVGDMVLTRISETDSRLVDAEVTKVYKHTVDEYLIINGDLRVTPVHRMLVNGEWQVAGKIRKGDQLVDYKGSPVKVFSIENVRGKFDVYNLEVDNYRTYFAGGIYVHNQKGGFDTTRTEFPDTAYWNPKIVTDENGSAKFDIKLPDSLTTWRLAAVAGTESNAFGSEVSEVTVSRDVLIRPFLPRFLAVGDKASLGAIVVNTSGDEQSLKVDISAEGLTVNGDKTKETVLADGTQGKIVWDVAAANVKNAKIKFTVSGSNGSFKDAYETTLPVNSYSIAETTATAGEVKDAASEKIVLPKDVDPMRGQAEITMTPSLGSASFQSLPYLFTYPYYCTEQITSRFLPAVFVNRIFKNAGIDSSGGISAGQMEAVISDGVQRLTNLQHPDGGWGWWSESTSDIFLTAYAYAGLYEAQKDGSAVPGQMLDRAKDYLMIKLDFANKNISPDLQAYILYVLQDERKNLSSYASTLYQRRFEMSVEGRAYLAIAIKDMGDMGDKGSRIYHELLSMAKKTSTTTHWEEARQNYYFMGSNVTATALMLEAMGVYDKNNPLVAEVIRYFMTSRHDNHWASTRDTAGVIKAVAGHLMVKGDQNVDENYKISLDGKTVKEGNFGKSDLLSVQNFTIAIYKLNIGGENKIDMAKSGAGNLYYNINLKYYLPFSEIDSLDRGIVVVREFVDEKGNILPSGIVPENSETWVRLIIVAPEERHYVVIEDNLPAGLESVNESLKNVSTLASEKPDPADKGNQRLYFAHKEYHDDKTTLFAEYLSPGVYEVVYRVRATTPGIYHYPPANAYQMYVPDVSGHSSGGWLTVK